MKVKLYYEIEEGKEKKIKVKGDYLSALYAAIDILKEVEENELKISKLNKREKVEEIAEEDLDNAVLSLARLIDNLDDTFDNKLKEQLFERLFF